MPQQLDSIGRTSRPGTALQHRLDRAHRAERLLVAMAVQMRDPPALVGERQRDAPGREVGREHLLEQERRAAASGSTSAFGSSAENSSRKVSRQEGSSPTTRAPLATKGASASSVRRASRRASSTMPADR